MKKRHSKRGCKIHRRADLRFAVIGGLLSSPPAPGELAGELDRLAEKIWTHPSMKAPVRIARSTIERWYYTARPSENPIDQLATKIRKDRGSSTLTAECIDQWRKMYEAHAHWTIFLLYINFTAWAKHERVPALPEIPSYSTLRRYYLGQGWVRTKKPRCREDGTPLPSSIQAEARRLGHEIRSYENEYVGGLWHLDFHKGSRAILMADGSWVFPVLLAILDDYSRLICHLQWYLEETSESLVHGFIQALQKRGLCRALMSDNGKPMKSEEFTGGLARLSIAHEFTLEYSPYQNGKQEKFWSLIEGRLLPMLEDVQPMTLSLLNDLTLIWVEGEYHRSIHSEINTTPIQRFSTATSVLRDSLGSDALRVAFVREVSRRQRKTDGTFSLDGIRFEIPSAYRHLTSILVHYQNWDLSQVYLVDPRTGKSITRILPLDKSKNNSGRRATHSSSVGNIIKSSTVAPRAITQTTDLIALLPPQMRHLLLESQKDHLPPAYIPQGQDNNSP